MYNMRRDLLTTCKYPSLYPLLTNWFKIAPSSVPNDKEAFGENNKVGRGLIATRDLKKDDIAYSVFETDYNVKITPAIKTKNFEGFPLAGGDQLIPFDKDDKPYLYFIQHNDVGNIKVASTQHVHVDMTCTLPTHLQHTTYTLCTHLYVQAPVV